MGNKDTGSGTQEESATSAPLSEAEIDYNLMETFPASDPPSWTLGIEPAKKSLKNLKDELSTENPSH